MKRSRTIQHYLSVHIDYEWRWGVIYLFFVNFPLNRSVRHRAYLQCILHLYIFAKMAPFAKGFMPKRLAWMQLVQVLELLH